MALVKIKEYYPDYADDFLNGKDFKGYSVYADTSDNKVGTVEDALVDEAGHIRYFVIDTGFWVFGKKVLLPIGRSRLDFDNERMYALGLKNKDQIEALPDYDSDTVVDYDYEERVRTGYRTTQPAASYDRDSYSYEHDRDLYDLDEQNRGVLRLYEERLIADKQRRKTGEVAIGKEVEAETARVSVPVETERVIVERRTPGDAGQPVAPGTASFEAGEVARVAVHEETADIRKETFVREEVAVRKEVDRDTVTAEEKVRREELKIDTDGEPTVKR
ncbi:MAG: DUF2382 domain-containing protein [Microcoleaceae cyanobacterium]